MFPGKHVVITGAADGIGKALTRKCLAVGALVSAIDIDPEKLTALEEEAKRHGQELKGFRADVSNTEEMIAVKKQILQWRSSIDYWVNNAGISGMGDFMQKPLEDFERTVAIDLKGVVLGTRLALETMEPLGSGVIVNMASVAGHIGCPYLVAYCASKFAVVGFSHALREELKMKDVPISICVVSPGFVDTKIIERGTQHGFPEWLSFLLSTPETVAEEIFRGVRKGKTDIFPTMNGRMLLRAHRYIPKVALKGSGVLFSKSFKDALLFRKAPPKK